MKGLLAGFVLLTSILCSGQRTNQLLKAAGTPVNPKVSIAWNRYYDSEALAILCTKIAKAHPDLAKLITIGKSYQGKRLLCLIITDFKKGKSDHKPAMYIQGNIHGNELQGAEFALYTAWYLTESYHDVKFIKTLLADKVFYIVPTINPDARDNFIHKAGTAGSFRFSVKLSDIDGDGNFNEDPFDDLDGDGSIAMMRIKNEKGIYRIDPYDQRRMIMLSKDSIIWLNGHESAKYPSDQNYDLQIEGGIDNDNDGKVDEDGLNTGAAFNKDSIYNSDNYDLNRNWDYTWNSNYKKVGNEGSAQPFSFPETKAVRDFFLLHSNIVIAQSFHNHSGEIAPAGSKELAQDSSGCSDQDINVYDEMGKHGLSLLPGYDYKRDLIQGGSYGGREIDWMYGKRGVFAFINELMSFYLLFNLKTGNGDTVINEMYDFSRDVLFDDDFVPWHQINHPTLGKVEVGGFKKNVWRLTPGFLMEMEAHRNMSFSLYMAYEAPKLEIKEIIVRDLEDGKQEVTAVVANSRLLPTHCAPDLKFNITRPDYVNLETKSSVLSVAQIEIDNCSNEKIFSEQKINPKHFELSNIPGRSEITIKWIVSGKGKFTVTVYSVRGGTASTTISN